MLVYPIGIQSYDQVSTLRSWSKVKLHRAVLLVFGLKEPKIALNIIKASVHSYPPNAYKNISLNSNSKKLVKSETALCCFTKVVIKGGENSLECRESWSTCLSIK